MEWKSCTDKMGLPKVNGKDVELLIKPDGLPFVYLSTVWDGTNLWVFSGKQEEPWQTLPETVHFKQWAYIVKPPIPKTIKRYTILNDGSKMFNMLFTSEEQEAYERYGYEHLFDLYLEVITHKNAKLSCDYLFRVNPYDKFTIGVSKILTYDLESTDISFGVLQRIFSYSMPHMDPDFIKERRKFYDVTYPKQREEDRLRFIDNARKEFRRNNKKKPTKADMKEIERKVDYNMSHFYCMPSLSPSMFPEYNCAEAEVGEKIEDRYLDEFVTWLKSINRFNVYHLLPNGKAVDYRNINFGEWKKLMNYE